MQRRKFLSLLVAAPAVGQQAAEQLAGVGVTDAMAAASGVAQPPAATYFGPAGNANMQLVAALKTGLIPDWFLRQSRNDAHARARLLDPDLATMRSLSLVAKVAIQAERNLARKLERMEGDALAEMAQAKFFGWNR